LITDGLHIVFHLPDINLGMVLIRYAFAIQAEKYYLQNTRDEQLSSVSRRKIAARVSRCSESKKSL